MAASGWPLTRDTGSKGIRSYVDGRDLSAKRRRLVPRVRFDSLAQRERAQLLTYLRLDFLRPPIGKQFISIWRQHGDDDTGGDDRRVGLRTAMDVILQ